MEVKRIFDRNRKALVIPDGLIVINREHNIIVFNEAASRLTEFGEVEITGKSINNLVIGDEVKEYLYNSFNKGKTYSNLSITIIDKSGKARSVVTSITPVIRDNEVINLVIIFRDTIEMVSLAEDLERKTRDLKEQKNRLDAIFNSSIEGTFTIDENWNITSFNNSAEKITGYSRAEATGKKCWEIFNADKCRNGCHMEKTMHDGSSTIGNEIEIITKEKKQIPIQVNSAVLLNNDGEKIGGVETFIDVSNVKKLYEQLEEKHKFENIVGKNNQIKKIISILKSVAPTDTTVLITGESGTGKELAAKAIHMHSLRREGPFVAVNCSAFVETLIESELFGHAKGSFTGAINSKPGKFELANGGTIFLDEIGDLSNAVQTKLLRVIESREYSRIGENEVRKLDARIITATNKNLMAEITKGNFREDFYYRINVINIHIPPLRDRKDDLPYLVSHFFSIFNNKFGKNIKRFTPNAYQKLIDYHWRGNIRELENVIEHCFVLCTGNTISLECLPENIREENAEPAEASPDSKVKNYEKDLIVKALQRNNYNRKNTAIELKINTSTLWRKMKKFGLLRN